MPGCLEEEVCWVWRDVALGIWVWGNEYVCFGVGDGEELRCSGFGPCLGQPVVDEGRVG